MSLRRQVLNFEGKRTDFRVGCGASDELSRMFKGTVARPRLAVLVADRQATELYGTQVCRGLVDAGFEVRGFALDEDRDPTELSTAVLLLEELGHLGATAEDLVVALGDADTCSLVTFCAASWCGGMPYVLVPTTLDAMVSSATVMRGLSAGDAAYMVSVQPHATLVVCDLDLVLDAPIEERGLGLVQIVAAYLSWGRKYWEGIDEVVDDLAVGGENAYKTAVSEAQTSHVNALKSTSPSARNALLYGYTTARALRACLGPDVPWYLLLAEGMRFEARLATEACGFSVDDVFKQDDCFEELGIEELPFSLDTEEFIAALKAERLRRANRFMLPLPKRAGFIRLTSVDDEVLERHAEAYLASREELLEEVEEGAGEAAVDEDAGYDGADGSDMDDEVGSYPGAVDSDVGAAVDDLDAGYDQLDADGPDAGHDAAADESDADDDGCSADGSDGEPADE